MSQACRGLRCTLWMVLIVLAASVVSAGVTTCVSAPRTGEQANAASSYGSVADDGTVAFASEASNLVDGDTNGASDIFIRRQSTRGLQRVSVSTSQVQANAASLRPVISPDGRYVVFVSWASNLVSGDTNGSADIFLHDRTTGQTTRISVASNGTQGNAGCATDTNDGSVPFDISPSGRYVAFVSSASNLVPTDANGREDVFLRDLTEGTTVLATVTGMGNQPDSMLNSCSVADNARVAFDTYASISQTDTNGVWDVYVQNWPAIQLRSYGSTLVPGNDTSIAPSLDAHAWEVAFYSMATNFVTGDNNNAYDVFLRNISGGTTMTRLSSTPGGLAGNGHSRLPDITADGKYVVYQSEASNLILGDTNGQPDIFGWSDATKTVQRVSVSSKGEQANSSCLSPRVSGNGRYVCFVSHATNLAGEDTNNKADIFLRDRWTPSIAFNNPTGQRVAPTATIRMTFDSAMNQASVEDAFSLSPAVSGVITWDANTFKFTPNAPLLRGRKYTVALSQVARSAQGITLPHASHWSFTVAPK